MLAAERLVALGLALPSARVKAQKAGFPSGGSWGYRRACLRSSGMPSAYSDTSVSDT